MHMKENFEESLLATNEKITEFKKSQDEGEKNTIKGEITQMGKDFVKKGIWTKETAAEIFTLQNMKNKIMGKLHEKLQAIDKDEPVIGFDGDTTVRSVSWNEKEEKAIITLPDGTKSSATKGEILTDPEWGILYEMDGTVPREVRKRFIVDDARRNILSLADDQILKTEIHQKPKSTSEFDRIGREHLTTAYTAVSERREKNEIQPGIVAEKIVKTFFQKMIIDCNLPIKIEDADIYEDVEGKIDFYIRIPKRLRGVRVEESEETEEIGVQLTMNTNPETQEKKKRQIAKAKRNKSDDTNQADDIVLVTLPISETAYPYINWIRKGMPPGGMTNILQKKFQEQIFRGVLQGLLPKNEIEEMLEIIEGKKPKPVKLKKEFEEELSEEISALNSEELIEEKEEDSKPEIKKNKEEDISDNLKKFGDKYGKWFKK